MLFQFHCKQTCKSASDGDLGHSSGAETMQVLEHHNTFGRSSLIATHMYVYICVWFSEWHFCHLGRSHSCVLLHALQQLFCMTCWETSFHYLNVCIPRFSHKVCCSTQIRISSIRGGKVGSFSPIQSSFPPKRLTLPLHHRLDNTYTFL